MFLPAHPLAAVATGAAVGIDLLIGTNRDELTLFGIGNPALMEMDDEGVERWVADRSRTCRSPRCWRLTGPPAPGGASRPRPGTCGSPSAPTWSFAGPACSSPPPMPPGDRRPFAYLFEWESPAFGGILGACHALELPFVFGAVDEPVVQMLSGGGPEAEELSRQMQDAWLALPKRQSLTRGNRPVGHLGSRRTLDDGVRCAARIWSRRHATRSRRCSNAIGRSWRACRGWSTLRREPR